MRTPMRRTLAATAAIVLTGALVAAAPAQAKGPKGGHGDTVDTSALTDAVTVRGILSHLRALQDIATANGGNRASGLPGHTASADYVADQLEKAGYTVTRQEFQFPFFQELEPATLTQLTPVERDLETATFDYSGADDVTGAVVPTNDVVIPATEEPSSTSGCEPEDFEAAPADPAIALIQRGSCDFAVKVANAEAAGYDAVIIFNEGNPGRTDLTVGTLGGEAGVPVVGLSYADAVELIEQAESGTVTAHVTTKTENDPSRTTENVIADLSSKDAKKVKNPNDTVVVGAHLDSVAAGPGINDNGSGSATILEIAEQMSALKLTKKLQRPVRFAFWGAEESGLLGAEHYVASLSQAERDGIYANLNFDMVGSPNYVRFVYDGDGSSEDVAGPPGSGAIEKIFTDYFDGQGLASAPTAFDGRSDYGPFIEAGIPAGGLFSGAEGEKTAEEAEIYGGTAGEAYDECYHSACDDITNINDDALFELGDAAAHATAILTMSKTGLFPDGSFAPKHPGKGHAKGHGKAGQLAHAAR
ncbi:M20/M25/M40 family metallo-hydrolase [Aeromicrobium terrae]|uniref:M20/M25/M40 family metallo-hydrolase n=2 Tax=Aeromicrobium terrae TaxID=2498846 RepID=A0A5C8NPC9_9ACTN|nr:M20/M25/M40 family metallo-hydrolase [Aeromicrobium terrae]